MAVRIAARIEEGRRRQSEADARRAEEAGAEQWRALTAPKAPSRGKAAREEAREAKKEARAAARAARPQRRGLFGWGRGQGTGI